MKWLRNFEIFKESKTYSNKNLITEMCVSMLLINNTFLDNILDRGLKARYNENSQVFLTDIKNLLIAKNRFKLGKFEDNKCVEDEETSKINAAFEGIKFDIEKDWNYLVNARTIARNIIDKLIPDEKLVSEDIKAVYWIGPNRTDDYKEDMVIELKDGKQFSFFLNKNLSTSKTTSFNTFADDLIGADLELLFSEEYLVKWNKLTQEWIRILYENANKDIQFHIEKFIDPKRIDSIGYFDYFDIRHGDLKYKHLGEFFKPFEKNILKFSDLLLEVWKNRDNCFMDPERVYKEWQEVKIVILNSKILENLLTTSLKSNFAEDISKLEDGFKLADGTVKMKLFKTLVEKMGCLERPTYYLSSNGNNFNLIPERQFFRDNYDDLQIKFDYHVNFNVSEEEDNNDFKIKINLLLDDSKLIDMDIIVKMTSEMSGKLSAKYKFDISSHFNYLVSTKKSEGTNEIE
jgi:hypothetical protein